jgi:hypothetical protein
MTIRLKARPHSGRIEHSILERPLLHACCGDDRDFFFGDISLDIDPGTCPDVVGDITALPFRDNTFAAAFADVPWVEKWRWQLGKAIQESLPRGPVCYIMAPWPTAGRRPPSTGARSRSASTGTVSGPVISPVSITRSCSCGTSVIGT